MLSFTRHILSSFFFFLLPSFVFSFLQGRRWACGRPFSLKLHRSTLNFNYVVQGHGRGLVKVGHMEVIKVKLGVLPADIATLLGAQFGLLTLSEPPRTLLSLKGGSQAQTTVWQLLLWQIFLTSFQHLFVHQGDDGEGGTVGWREGEGGGENKAAEGAI